MRIKSPFGKVTALILSFTLLFGTLSIFAAAEGEAALFNDYVAAIDRADSLVDKMAYREMAEATLFDYVRGGGSETDAEIAESYARFGAQCLEIEAHEALCIEFIEAVENALTPDLSYEILTGYLAEAEAVLESVDKDYVGEYITDYKGITSDLQARVDTCETYIAYAKAAAESKTFAEAKDNYESAMRAEASVQIEDYPGLDEARANLAKANTMMFLKMKDAQDFIRAVENISRAESIPAGIKAAYAVLEKKDVDITTEGADEAMRTLRTAETSYNRKVNQSNDLLDEINSFVFNLLF